MTMPWTHALAMAWVLFSATPLHAEAQTSENRASDDQFLSIMVENDLFASGTDRHYTHGTRVAWLSATEAVPGVVRDAVALVPWIPDGAALRWALSAGQNMYTPEDLTRSDLIIEDRPYAGWLYGSAGMVADGGDTLDTLEITFGMVGPSSQAEPTQKLVHRLIDSQNPEGWDHQLKDEPGLIISYERVWRTLWDLGVTLPLGNALQVELSPRAGGSLGNVYTYAEVGGMIRLGANLDADFGAPRIRPSLPGSILFHPSRDWAFYLFAGMGGRAVAHNVFLDGNTWRDSHSVDRRTFNGDVQGGFAVTVGGVRFSYTQIFRTKEFNGQKAPDRFGAFNVSFRL